MWVLVNLVLINNSKWTTWTFYLQCLSILSPFAQQALSVLRGHDNPFWWLEIYICIAHMCQSISRKSNCTVTFQSISRQYRVWRLSRLLSFKNMSVTLFKESLSYTGYKHRLLQVDYRYHFCCRFQSKQQSSLIFFNIAVHRHRVLTCKHNIADYILAIDHFNSWLKIVIAF